MLLAAPPIWKSDCPYNGTACHTRGPSKNDVKSEIERFDHAVEERMSDQNFILGDPDGFYIQDEPDATPASTAIHVNDEYGDMNLPETPDADNIDDAQIAKYLNAELIFDVGTGNERKGRVVKRARGTSGEPIG